MNKNKKFSSTVNQLSLHYDLLVKKFGYDVKSSQQSNKETREKRLIQLTKYIEIKKDYSILDFGCGTGYLYEFLEKKNFKGKYLGIDISNEAITIAKKKFFKKKNAKFKNQDIFTQPLRKKYDYIIINGTFNNYTKNNWEWMLKCLELLFLITKKKIVFNNLSTYVDYFDRSLFYLDPLKVFNYIKKNISDSCIIDHSYSLKKNIIPYEFTTVIIKKK
jgi:SAM-dependent methyltransferase